jgi:hypothetical protein
MAKGSQLCRTCRPRAVAVGVAAIQSAATSDDAPITSGQRSAIHAKAGQLARQTGGEKAVIVGAKLAAAERRFGRSIASVNDLTRSEASWVLDQLESELAA